VALSINDLKTSLTILVDGEVFMVIDSQHIKPGKGAAFCRAKLRNLKTTNVLERTFRGDEKIPEAYVDERKLQYLYSSGEMYHFMAQDNYEEVALSKENLGDSVKFLKDGLEVTSYSYKGDILNVVLPNFIVFTIINTEPGIRGDTSKSGTKPAEIDSGAVVQVPLFVDVNDKIKIDTRTGSYVERAS
jgi:elongation factor P